MPGTERRPWYHSIEFCAIFVFSTAYWGFAGTRGARTPFWYDELETWHIARLPSVPAMWEAIRGGVDNNMLLSHTLVRLSHNMFGTGYLATRFPALLGVWVMSLCLFAFLRRRLPLPYALIGMIFPMLTMAWHYTAEARAYGPWLGFSALALLAWQRAAEDEKRLFWLVLITAGLSGALLCHPFAVMLAIPFALGEIVRSLQRRRIDWPIWIAYAVSAPITIIYFSLLEPMKHIDMRGTQPGLSIFGTFYMQVFSSAVAPLILAGTCTYLLSAKKSVPEQAPISIFPAHELAALLGFALAPVVLLLCIVESTSMVYSARYGIYTVIGVAGLVSSLLYRTLSGNVRSAAILFTALFVWFVAARGREALSGSSDPAARYRDDHAMVFKAAADGRPVLINDQITFLESEFYLPAEQADRVYYASFDPQLRRRYPWQDMGDQLLEIHARFIHLNTHVEPWRKLSARYSQFVVHIDNERQCLYDTLLGEGWKLTMIAHSGGESLYVADRPKEIAAAIQ
jgi:hypothetical protein